MDGSIAFASLRQCAHPSNMLPLANSSSQPKRHLDRFSDFCTAHTAKCPYTLQWSAPFPLKIAASHCGSGPPTNTQFLRPTWGHSPKGILIGSAAFSERHTFAICYRPSVCRLSSVTFVRPTQAVQIFGNISTALGTLDIHWHSLKISRRLSQGDSSARGVKHKRGSQI